MFKVGDLITPIFSGREPLISEHPYKLLEIINPNTDIEKFRVLSKFGDEILMYSTTYKSNPIFKSYTGAAFNKTLKDILK